MDKKIERSFEQTVSRESVARFFVTRKKRVRIIIIILQTQLLSLSQSQHREKKSREKEYGWDVESDAMEWETAISGMKTMRRNIEELQEEGHV